MAVYRIESVLNGTQGAPYYNRLHFLDAAGPDEIFAQAAADAVRQFWVSLAPALDSDLTVAVQPEITAFDETTDAVVAVYVHQLNSVAGSSNEEPLPYQIQGLVQLRTGVFVGQRERRGRMFIPGLGEAQNVDGRPTAEFRTLLAGYADALVQHDPTLCIYTEGRGANAVTSAAVWDQWATLRTRRD